MSGFAVRRLASPVTANVLGGFCVVLVAAGIALDVLGHEGNLAQSIANLLVYVMLGAAGLVVARAQPRNALGWMLLAAALGLALSSAAGEYEVLIYRQGHAALPFGPAAVLLNLLWSPGIVSFGLIVLLFPDGRLTRGWRRFMWAYLAVGACWPAGIYAVAVRTVAGHRIRVDSGGGLISRTLAYAIVTGLLAGCYIGVVALGTHALPFKGSVAVAVSTLAVAALFNPVRRRVQRIVDRRFNRARYDADRTVSAFAARLQDAVDPAAVQADLLSAVQRSLEPAHASLWLSRE
jgi:hypothetical protein